MSEETPVETDETLVTLIQSYEVSSKLQQQVLSNIRAMADSALNNGETGLSNGESTVLWALSQQLDVLHSQMTLLEQLNLTILKKVLELHPSA